MELHKKLAQDVHISQGKALSVIKWLSKEIEESLKTSGKFVLPNVMTISYKQTSSPRMMDLKAWESKEEKKLKKQFARKYICHSDNVSIEQPVIQVKKCFTIRCQRLVDCTPDIITLPDVIPHDGADNLVAAPDGGGMAALVDSGWSSSSSSSGSTAVPNAVVAPPADYESKGDAVDSDSD
eukprot:9472817-Pyramimonas_sp.AAC.1